jgi:hypothetical protein
MNVTHLVKANKGSTKLRIGWFKGKKRKLSRVYSVVPTTKGPKIVPDRISSKRSSSFK